MNPVQDRWIFSDKLLKNLEKPAVLSPNHEKFSKKL